MSLTITMGIKRYQKLLRATASSVEFILNNTGNAVNILLADKPGTNSEAIEAIVNAETLAKGLRDCVLKELEDANEKARG